MGNEWKICEGEKVVVFEDNGNSQKIFAYFPYAKDISFEEVCNSIMELLAKIQ